MAGSRQAWLYAGKLYPYSRNNRSSQRNADTGQACYVDYFNVYGGIVLAAAEPGPWHFCLLYEFVCLDGDGFGVPFNRRFPKWGHKYGGNTLNRTILRILHYQIRHGCEHNLVLDQVGLNGTAARLSANRSGSNR